MPLNDPRADQSSARKPRARMLLTVSGGTGTSPLGLDTVQVTSNNWYQCDEFSATLAVVPGSTYDEKWWADQTDVQVEIQFGFLPSGKTEGSGNVAWESVFTGGVDQIDIDPFARSVTLEGRDLSFLLIEAKTDEAFQNKTSSEIVTVLAQRHDLTPVVTKTTTLVDRYYEMDHTKVAHGTFHREQTEWDLAVYLAQREHFDLFVTKKELHFQPKTPPNTDPFVIQFHPAEQGRPARANVETLKMTRNLILAKDIEVDVSSWDSQHKKGYTVTAKKSGGKSAQAAPSGGKHSLSAQKFAYVFPNMPRAEAQRRALNILTQITQHEKVISFDMPGITGMTARTLLRLTGTRTAYDQTYFVDHIVRSLSFDQGFTQSVRAKNMDTSSQIAAA